MLESVMLLFLVFVSGISLLLTLIFIIKGLIGRTKTTIPTGLRLLIIPLIASGLIFLYYEAIVPRSNRNQESEYTGRYVLDSSKSHSPDSVGYTAHTYYLTLNEDNTFEIDTVPFFNMYDKGKWEAGWIDGHFVFKDSTGSRIVGSASPRYINGKRGLEFSVGDREVVFVQE